MMPMLRIAITGKLAGPSMFEVLELIGKEKMQNRIEYAISTFRKMGRLKLQTLKICAYHGCFKEETKIGGEYHLDLWMEADFSDSEQSDELSKTIDYVEVADLAAQEMKTPSKLIEHVANRILVKIMSNWKF